MIQSLSDVQNYLLKQAYNEDDPLFRRRYMMTSPGIMKESIDLITRDIGTLPVSYLSFLENYNLNGVDIGYFGLSPLSYNPGGIITNLKEANHDPFFPKEFMEKHRMYQIGSYNTDLVCVTAGTDQFKEGEILFVEEGYDIYNPEDNQIHPLAKDFEQFLIAAGNLNEIHREIKEDNSNWEEKKNEFIERLRLLGVDENYHKAWLNVF